MELIPDFTQNSEPVPVKVQLSAGETSTTRLGRNTWIAAIPSGLSNATDLILGNTAGGLIYLKDVSPTTDGGDQEGLALTIFPNPSAGPVSILASTSGTISLINTLGQVLMQDIPITAGQPLPLNIKPLSSGVYIVQLVSQTGKRLSKKLIFRGM